MLKRFRRLILVNGCFALLLFTHIVAASDKTILVMGDSLSAGYGIDLQQSWVQQLQDKLSREQRAYTVINASVSGETTTGGAARLARLLQTHKPELVLLELGGNDGLRGQPIKIMRSNLSQMIEASRAINAKVVLVGIQIPPNYGARYAGAFANMFPALAQAHDIALVPFLLEGVALNPELMQSDGIHPVAEAQPLMLGNVWPVLEPLL
ncbi:arylesterase [Gilvimarinus sp. SDUM040013]|uniref:Arylesterase n=1 Tax=Gilvimarinus gilvus TaxID=3058038 RepID=A0ABU4RT92_9GAMM|nr:arylesterase [Gilvimarinus sp. SDUM040013]MDO3387005.1 arylesterase [Gilvimarinus sp. SDUM040013]MDX6848101.1 arylesterase [Gilvimarinus sp. SDUM040013]